MGIQKAWINIGHGYMTDFITKIGKYEKFDLLHDYVLELVKEYNHVIKEHNQLAIQWADNPTWDNCMGWQNGKIEEAFYKIMPELAGSPIDEFIQSLPYPVYRSRIFITRPKGQAYTVHRDRTERIHLPIHTNNGCYFMQYKSQEDTQPIKHPTMSSDGSMYLVDTTKYHTFFNDGREDRIHIVCGMKTK